MKVNAHDPRGGRTAQVPRATAALAQVPSPRVGSPSSSPRCSTTAQLTPTGRRHGGAAHPRPEYEALVARRVCREPLQHTGPASLLLV